VKKQAFDELTESVRLAGKIRRGEMAPARKTTFEPARVKSIRKELGLTQEEFAMMIGVSVARLRNWEQGEVYRRGRLEHFFASPPKTPKRLPKR